MVSQTELVTESMVNIVVAIATVRMDWEQAQVESLLDAQASVGLILADITRAANFTFEQQRIALGSKLHEEVSRHLDVAK